MSEEGNIPASGDNGANEAEAAGIRVIAQYVKDLSFENPSAPMNPSIRPQIELAVDLQARAADHDVYEVEMKLRVVATHENKPAFLLELVYGGLFMLRNIPDEIRNQVLLIEAPHVLFPFVRRIVADVVRDGGLPTLMIEPIDFAALYRSRAAEMQPAPSEPGPQPFDA
jgi:preprotein translocase subunit SecB